MTRRPRRPSPPSSRRGTDPAGLRRTFVVTCEHAGHRVPAAHRALFRGAASVLGSHRGWDPGALPIARRIAAHLGVPLLAHDVTRLLVEVNRSVGHPRLFSEFTRNLPDTQRAALLREHYHPHRDAVARACAAAARRGCCVHLGIHTFSPDLDPARRDFEVGLLYDPARTRERTFCRDLRRRLRALDPALRVRMNRPYLGRADGLTTALRTRFAPSRYLGIEVEVSQAPATVPARARALADVLAAALVGG